MAKKPPLSLVGEQVTTAINPPRTLGKHGRSLWDRIMSTYDIRDSGGIELLTLACQALDRAESLRERIDAEGEVIIVRGTPKEHPAVKAELANRAFVARSLSRLGLDVEPLRSAIGRPPSGVGWIPPHAR
jgi:phage terminase small subunit